MKAVRGLETRGKAEAAGWVATVPYVPGLGTHHVKVGGMGTPGVPPGSMPSSADIERIGQCLQEKGVNLSGGFPNLSDPGAGGGPEGLRRADPVGRHGRHGFVQPGLRSGQATDAGLWRP